MLKVPIFGGTQLIRIDSSKHDARCSAALRSIQEEPWSRSACSHGQDAVRFGEGRSSCTLNPQVEAALGAHKRRLGSLQMDLSAPAPEAAPPAAGGDGDDGGEAAAAAVQKQMDTYSRRAIVGAGSAGCVLANELTQDASASVLLIEAGTLSVSSIRRRRDVCLISHTQAAGTRTPSSTSPPASTASSRTLQLIGTGSRKPSPAAAVGK